MGEHVTTAVRMTTAIAGVIGALLLAGCSSQPDPLPPEPTATQSFATPTPVADGTTVADGEWGIVTYHNGSDGDQTFALRVTDVTAGDPGEFSEIKDFGGGDLASASDVPWWIDYDWVRIDGAEEWWPNHQIGAAAADESDQERLSTLSVPADYIHCAAPETESSVGTPGLVQHGCVTATAAKGVRPVSLAFNSLPPGTQDVRWTLPSKVHRD